MPPSVISAQVTSLPCGTAQAPWIVVEGSDPEYRAVTVGKTLLEEMRKRLEAPAKERRAGVNAPPLTKPVDNVHVLSEVFMPDVTPHATNTRADLSPIAEKYAEQEPIFGIEQEYTFFK